MLGQTRDSKAYHRLLTVPPTPSDGGPALHLARGTYVGVSHVVPNYDAKTFPEPDKFDPSRYVGRQYSDLEYTTFRWVEYRALVNSPLHQSPVRPCCPLSSLGQSGSVPLAWDLWPSFRAKWTFLSTLSHGVHRCPGQQLALLLSEQLLSVLLAQYR